MNKSSRDDDFLKIQTTSELKQFVKKQGLSPDEMQGQKKFVPRVFYVLQYVKNHPEAMEEIGVSWCSDNFHFVANSKKLASFLDLKSNSINTNFRDHGFKIIQNNTTELKKQFPSIKETRHWKIRYSSCQSFRTDSTSHDVENIKSVKNNVEQLLPINQNDEKANASNTDQGISFIPPETIELLQYDQSQICSLLQMYYNITADSTFYFTFLKYITNIWKTSISTNSEAEIEKVKSTILYTVNNSEYYNTLIPLYEENLEYLLQQNHENSQICDYVTFYTFASFFMRYCDWHDYSHTLREITPNELTNNANFFNWFHPSASKAHAIQLLQGQTTESWIVIQSKTPNMFTLLFTVGNHSNISSLHIIHNPIPEDKSKRYSIDDKDSETLNDIFSNILKLDTSGIQPEIQYQPSKTQNVSVEDIANRKSNINDNNDDNNDDNNTQTFNFDFLNNSQNSQTFPFSENNSQLPFRDDLM